MSEQVNINVNETNENINITSTEIVEVIDINVGETIEEVTLNITEEVIQVNINKVTGGGGEQTLAETLVLGNNTGGTDILLNNDDAIQLENNSSIRKGSYDFGQNGGVSRICGVDFEDMWQGGIRHVFDNNGYIRNSTNCFNVVPNNTFDITLRFKVGSIWTLDDGTNYICTDATEAAAVWELYNVIPTSTSDLTNDGEDGVNPYITAADVPSQVNSDWNAISGVEEILNKPSIPTNTSDLTNDSNFVSDADYIHTDNNFTDTLKTKLDGIADGAEVNVNADWNATSGDAQILNKPTIPSLTGYVPYTGANNNLDLGTYNLTADHISLNVSPSGAGFVVGATEWNNDLGSSQTLLKGGNVTLKNGVDLVARVVNKVTPNTTLTKAAYQVVKVSGAQGQRLAVDLAQANTDLNSADTLGVVTETIATNQEGFILTVGQLLDINTTGSLQGETWADGDVLYLSPTTAGRITNIKPTGATGHIVVLGYVEYAHSSQGKIYVKIMNGWELDELHNVYISSIADKQLLSYDSATLLWKNKSVTTADIADSTNKRYVTDANLTTIGNQSGTNTGDETTATIKTKLGITTLSGSNTGDQDLSGLAPIESPTLTGTLTTPAIIVSSETASTIASFDASKNIKSLSTATYPTLTELSYVKGVTSAIQTQINGKVTKNTWIDYSATSTIVGWSSFTVKEIWILIVGDILFCQFILNGTSNSTTTSFTINNNNPSTNLVNVNTYVVNAGATQTGPGRIVISNGSNVVSLARLADNTLYSATGNKQAIGQFFMKL